MQASVNKKDTKKIDVFAESDDLCYLCVNAEVCPLLGAIKTEMAVLRYENVQIEKCGMYDEVSLQDLIFNEE